MLAVTPIALAFAFCIGTAARVTLFMAVAAMLRSEVLGSDATIPKFRVLQSSPPCRVETEHNHRNYDSEHETKLRERDGSLEPPSGNAANEEGDQNEED